MRGALLFCLAAPATAARKFLASGVVDTWKRLNTLKANGFVPEHVLDIGANQGKWSQKVATVWPPPNTTYFLVEANPKHEPSLNRSGHEYAISVLGDVSKSVTMNEGLKAILGDAFAFCSSLESVYLPRSLTHIQENGHIFEGCWNLKEIRVPKGLKRGFSADTFDLVMAKLFFYDEDGNEEHYMTGCLPAFDAIESDYDANINADRCANFDYQAHMNAEYAAHLARLNAY